MGALLVNGPEHWRSDQSAARGAEIAGIEVVQWRKRYWLGGALQVLADG